MKKLRVMDSTGDTVVEFDETVKGADAEARALFERLTQKGAAAFDIGKGGESRKVTRFEDLGDETVLVPLIVGG